MLSAEGARACLLWKGMLRFSAYKRVLTLQSDSLKDEEGETASSAVPLSCVQADPLQWPCTECPALQHVART